MSEIAEVGISGERLEIPALEAVESTMTSHRNIMLSDHISKLHDAMKRAALDHSAIRETIDRFHSGSMAMPGMSILRSSPYDIDFFVSSSAPREDRHSAGSHLSGEILDRITRTAFGLLQESIPEHRSAIESIVIEAKNRILSLEENWDGEGSPAYQADTLDDAADFLYKLDGPEAEQVKILPDSEGSIDLWWKTEKFELIIEFHPNGSGSYYGDDYSGNLIQGVSRPKPGFITCWMKHTSE